MLCAVLVACGKKDETTTTATTTAPTPVSTTTVPTPVTTTTLPPVVTTTPPPTYYTVDFDSAGADPVPSQSLTFGQKAEKPADPTLDGFVFCGWYLDGALYDFNQPVVSSFELVAVWEEIRVDNVGLSFDMQGATPSIETQVIPKGTAPTRPQDPVREGYTFGGWYYLGEEFDFATKLGDSITVSALWIPVRYEVRFEAGEGAVSNAALQRIVHGDRVTRPKAPTREGYLFAGWQKDGADYDFSAPVTASFTLVAKWDVDPDYKTAIFTVTFDSAGGTAVSPAEVREGEQLRRPADPTRDDGLVIEGWYLGDVRYDFTQPVTSSFTLVAKWKDPTVSPITYYTVTFDTDGGSSVRSQSVPEGYCATRPSNPKKSDFGFAGWYLDGEPFSFDTKIEGDITLVAKWVTMDEMSYTVSFSYYNKDGKYVTSYKMVKHGQAAENPEDMLGIACTWSRDVSSVTEDMNVKAVYESKTWQYVHTNKDNLDKTFARSETITNGGSSNFSKVGDWIAFSYIGERFISIYVNKPASGSLTLTMYDNGEVISSITVDQNTPNDQIRFLQNMVYGLHNIVVQVTAVSEDFSGQVFSNSMIYCGAPSTVPYYPAWANSKHTVSFDSGGGSAVESQTVAENAAATEPTAPTLAGYRFLGWYLGEELYDFASPVVADLKLVAKWEALTPYQVTFDPANGQATFQVTAYEGQPVAEPTAPTKDGHRFLGWFAEGSDTAYDFSAPVSAALTLVAKWEEIPASDIYTVTFTGEGVDLPAQTVYKGDKAQRPTDPEREGYRFLGWYAEGSDTAFDFAAELTGSVTLVAGWRELTGTLYTVTFKYYNVNGQYVSVSQQVAETESAIVPTDALPLGQTWDVDFSSVESGLVVTAVYEYGTWKQLPTNNAANVGVTFDRCDTMTHAKNSNFKAVGEWVGVSYVGKSFFGPYIGASSTMTGSALLALYDNGVLLGYTTVRPGQANANVRICNDIGEGLHNLVLILVGVSDDFSGEVNFTLIYYNGTSVTAPYRPATLPTDLAVLFDAAGGSLVDGTVVASGATLTAPTAPTRDGYQFLGWYLGEELYDFSQPVTETMTLVAKWEANPRRTVTFDSDEGSAVAPQTVDDATCATEPDVPTREGYVFLGWFLGEAEEPFEFSTPITSDITLTARWIAKTGAKYTVTFCYYGTDGTWKETPVEVEEGQDATVPADVLPLHLTWEGDYTGVTADCTVTATYVRANWQQLPLRDKQSSNTYLDRLYARGETVTEAGQIQFNEIGDWIGFSYYGDNLQVKFAGGNGVDKLTLGLQNMVLYVSAVSADFEGSVQLNMCYYCGSSGADGTVNGTVPYVAKPSDLIYPAE